MDQLNGVTSSRGRGVHTASTNKQAADSRAAALASTIRQLMASGFVSQRELAGELNRRGIPTALGGSWHRTTVVRMLTRLDLIKLGKGRINNGLATKQAADVRAEAYSPTIGKLRKAGFLSAKDIARELNVQGIPTAQGGKWHPSSVKRLLRRLERLEPSSTEAPAPTSDVDSK